MNNLIITFSAYNTDQKLKDKNMAFDEKSAIAPVIIEELDENALNNMNVDMTEFIEAQALEIEDVPQNVISDVYSRQSTSAMDITTEEEDHDLLITADEEDQLTKQFLNGELTFSEYSSRMDQDIDLETAEFDFSR